MVSRRIITGVAIAGAAAAAMLGAASSASAATPVPNIVNVGGSTTTGTVSATATPGSTVTLTDTTTNTVLTCNSPANSVITASVNRGANSSGTAATVAPSGVKFGTATYSGATAGGGSITAGGAPCTASGGSVPVAVVGCSTWAVQTTGPSTTNPHPPTGPASGQVTPGQIANICADVYLGSTNSCHFRVSGLVTGTYTNTNTTNGTLTVNPNLTTTLTSSGTSNPSSGCVGGLIQNGHSFKFGGANASTVANYAVKSGSSYVWVNA